MKIDLNKIKEYDYSDTSTARELIYMLTEELQKTYKLQDDLIEAITKKANFLNDIEKMHDFRILTKKEFLQSYSYLTEQEYDNTTKAVNQWATKLDRDTKAS